jgi:hypothetical protein
MVMTALLASPAALRAQSLPPPPTGPVVDPADTAKVKIGPLFMQPAFGFKNVGLENNVFNDSADPKKDWTATVNMGMLAGVRYGPGRLTVRTSTDYVYFAEYASERSIDGATRLQAEVRSDRFRSWIGMDRAKTHERVGLEIDSRAGREIPAYDAGVEYRFGFRLGTRAMVRQRKVDFEDEEEFRGVALKDTLNAKYEEASLQLLYEISPLSNFRLSGEASRSRFDVATVRDASEMAVFAGIEGKKDAAIEGYIDLGWRERVPENPLAPAYSGVVVRAAAAFVLWEELLVSFAADRDIPMSYDDAFTYYVQQGGSSVITWRFHDRFDIVATGRRYQLKYDRAIDPSTAVLRTDTTYGYGGGFGFFLHGYPGTRLGLSFERNARQSVLADHRYDNTRFLTHVGFSF